MVFESFSNSTMLYNIVRPASVAVQTLILIGISFFITLIITVAYKYFTDQNLMKSLKEDTKRLQSDMKNHKDNPTKMMEIQKEAMEKNMKYMMHSFKPTLITLIPLLIIFAWLRNAYKGIDLNFLGFIHNWIWLYILVSIISSIILRKLLKVH